MPGRNDPCPCGSGKKFKHCHLGHAEAAPVPDVHAMDHEVIEKIAMYIDKKFPEAFVPNRLPRELLLPFIAYHSMHAGVRIIDSFLSDRGWTLGARERAWVEAQRNTVPTIAEITEVRPGFIVVRDAFSDKLRTVRELKGSQAALPGLGVLARITPFEEGVYFTGMHPQPLGPTNWKRVVERARKELGVIKDADSLPGDHLIELSELWEEEIEVIHRPRRLQNTTGEDVLLTTDTFIFEPAAEAHVLRKLRRLANIEETDDGHFVIFLGSWSDSILASVKMVGNRLVVQTNSVKRADKVRKRIERVIAGVGQHQSRALEDPLSAAHDDESLEVSAHDAEQSAIVAEYKRKHYDQWLDDHLPAFGGRTPREMVKTTEGRVFVDALIAQMEVEELKSPFEEQFDFRHTRKTLGLLPEIKPGDLLRGTWLSVSTEGIDQLISVSIGEVGTLSLMLHRTPSYEQFDPERSGVAMKLLGLDDRDDFDRMESCSYAAAAARLTVRSNRRELVVDLSETPELSRSEMIRVLRAMNFDDGFELQEEW